MLTRTFISPRVAVPALGGLAVSLVLLSSTPRASTPIGTSFAYVQGARGYETASFAATPVAGDTVIAACYSGGSINSITDNQSPANTYTKVLSEGGGAGNTELAVFVATNVHAAGSFTVTCNTAPAQTTLTVMEYAGIYPAAPIDAFASADGYSKIASSGSITTNGVNELLVGIVGLDGGGVSAAGAGYTLRVANRNGWPLYTEDKAAASIGSYAATATLGSSTSWRAAVIAFRAGSSTAPPPVPTATLTASSATITAGSSTTLTWTTTNATSVSIDNGIGSVAVSGSTTVTPTVTTTYSLTATGGGGTASVQQTVTVNGGSPSPTVCSTVAAMPVVSSGVPAYASSVSGTNPPSNADGPIYDVFDYHSWKSAGVPAWIAYDLSAVPSNQRGLVDITWFNNTDAYDYLVASGGTPEGMPKNYTIEANAAAGGTTAPATGWVTLAAITGNVLHSRQHVVDLTGYNWVRVNVSAVIGGSNVVLMHLDVQDLSACGAPLDSWIFYGDSITLGATNYQEYYDGSPDNFTIAQLVNAQLPQFWPAQEDGGTVGADTIDALDDIDGWLALFPGKYVDLSYGTNDAGTMDPDVFYSNYAALVQKVLAAGKVPIVPKIPWGKTAAVQTYGPLLNAKIDALYSNFPQVIPGPDFWTFFEQNPNLITNGDVHPTDEGYGQMRQLWAQMMIQSVYAK